MEPFPFFLLYYYTPAKIFCQIRGERAKSPARSLRAGSETLPRNQREGAEPLPLFIFYAVSDNLFSSARADDDVDFGFRARGGVDEGDILCAAVSAAHFPAEQLAAALREERRRTKNTSSMRAAALRSTVSAERRAAPISLSLWFFRYGIASSPVTSPFSLQTLTRMRSAYSMTPPCSAANSAHTSAPLSDTKAHFSPS